MSIQDIIDGENHKKDVEADMEWLDSYSNWKERWILARDSWRRETTWAHEYVLNE